MASQFFVGSGTSVDLVVGAELLAELQVLAAPLDVVSHDRALLVLLLDQEDGHRALGTCRCEPSRDHK